MSKIKSPEAFLLDLGIKYQDGVTMIGVLNIRITNSGWIDVGEEDFDRWANSVDYSFDLMSAKGQRSFKRWLCSINDL